MSFAGTFFLFDHLECVMLAYQNWAKTLALFIPYYVVLQKF